MMGAVPYQMPGYQHHTPYSMGFAAPPFATFIPPVPYPFSGHYPSYPHPVPPPPVPVHIYPGLPCHAIAHHNKQAAYRQQRMQYHHVPNAGGYVNWEECLQ
jgi:hypothetical protein